ncbi:hypothetical protein IFT73_00435 [Aeromicrobium sp. CFBP 8757]|uniref:hypothetical protein n=1 Tax=Aeromicrobium sp. CFBP 8757 TaxID=2775288 RepID=UPI00177E0C59|nr:hypothetical protein [Aeromicrobium sp. CFBP 8757]MBD8605304.1 hypothetical protein [Aeromicrobium sp. CFBP 8757]
MTDIRTRTFSAGSGAGPRPWGVLLVAIPALVVAVYFLGIVLAAVVALVTAVIVVPLALRHRRLESTGEVDVTADTVTYRRGGSEQRRLDRRSSAYEVVSFSDRYGMNPQLLLTDGSQHVRLVRGQWTASTLTELAAAAADGSPRVATWQEVKAEHGAALAWWERHTTALIVGTVIGLPVLAIVGAVLAVLLFDVG